MRELEEETTLIATEFAYLFQFSGFNTLPHVFLAGLAHHSISQPSNEIAKCKWFAPVKIGTLSTSVPTQGIVALFSEHVAAVEDDSLEWMPEQVGEMTL